MVVSGIIVVSVIVSGKYYHTETYCLGAVTKLFIFLVERKVVNDGKTPNEGSTLYRSGKTTTNLLDKIFILLSYFIVWFCILYEFLVRQLSNTILIDDILF